MLFKRIKDFIKFIITRAGYELLEFANGGLLLLAAWAILDPSTDLFSNGTSYRVIAHFFSENSIGFVFLVLGCFKWTALLDGNLRFRQYVSFVVTGFWFFMFLGLLYGNPTGVLYRWIIFLAMLSIIVAGRISSDRKVGIPPWTQRI